ncbi:MAG: GNAT family N-acetyltransferase [Alphaproteobacteria bacterium]
MADPDLPQRIESVRAFNRFYTQRIGALHESHSNSPFPLPEARVLYELAHRAAPTATELARELGLDTGYLSRILARFETRGLIERKPVPRDRRQSTIRLTRDGRAAFAPLDAASRAENGALLEPLSDADQRRLIDAMATVQRLLGGGPGAASAYLLRPHQPGDMGWVVRAHGLLYAREYGWDERFEAMVAGIVARFIDRFDPKRERCWIAELDGEIVGSVFVVRNAPTVAQLRMLIVDPRARGLGIGARLVEECIRFARQSGYKKLTLWTNSILLAARQIYVNAGFRMVRAEPHHSFGHDLIGETWDLKL